MISEVDIALGAARLNAGKLTKTDVNSLISVFRILTGPLEADKGYDFKTDLTALDDLDGENEEKAAKMAGTLLRIIDEDFGVDTLMGDLLSNDYEQRRIYALFAFSLLYPIPAELSSIAAFERYLKLQKEYSTAVKTVRYD